MGKEIKVRPFLVFFRGFLMESSIISLNELKNAIINLDSPILKGPEVKLSLKLGEMN